MGAIWTDTFTPTEAAALTELPGGRQVRKEIEHKVIETARPPRLSFAALVYLRALKLMEMHLSVEDRARISRRLVDAIRRFEGDRYGARQRGFSHCGSASVMS